MTTMYTPSSGIMYFSMFFNLACEDIPVNMGSWSHAVSMFGNIRINVARYCFFMCYWSFGSLDRSVNFFF